MVIDTSKQIVRKGNGDTVHVINDSLHIWCIVAVDEEGTDTPRRFFGSQDEARKELAICRDVYEGIASYELSDMADDALKVTKLRHISEGNLVVSLKVTTIPLIEALNIAMQAMQAITPIDYITKPI
jgi:hypothetical protein